MIAGGGTMRDQNEIEKKMMISERGFCMYAKT